jgi:uncharacterized MAPEG superfamily protein
MTIAYWCLLVAGLLPYVWVVAAKSAPGFDNRAPRAFLDTVTGWRRRALWAQYNAFEVLPLFIAAVIVAHLTHVPQARVDTLAVAFVGFRLLHGLLYIADRSALRSLAWTGGFVCVLALFVSSAR